MKDDVAFLNSDIFELNIKNKVDAVITSPPYWGIDPFRYGGAEEKQINFTQNKKEFINLLTEATKKIYELLSPEGVLLINIGLKEDLPFRYIVEVLDNTKFILNETLIWDISDPSSKLEKLYGSIQPWFVLSKKQKIYANPFYAKKNPGTVLRFPGENNKLHDDAQLDKIGYSGDAFPIELIDFLLNMFTKPRQTILDPFGGSGIVAVSSLKNNRKAIISDISPIQIEMAKKRVQIYLDNDSI